MEKAIDHGGCLSDVILDLRQATDDVYTASAGIYDTVSIDGERGKGRRKSRAERKAAALASLIGLFRYETVRRRLRRRMLLVGAGAKQEPRDWRVIVGSCFPRIDVAVIPKMRGKRWIFHIAPFSDFLSSAVIVLAVIVITFIPEMIGYAIRRDVIVFNSFLGSLIVGGLRDIFAFFQGQGLKMRSQRLLLRLLMTSLLMLLLFRDMDIFGRCRSRNCVHGRDGGESGGRGEWRGNFVFHRWSCHKGISTAAVFERSGEMGTPSLKMVRERREIPWHIEESGIRRMRGLFPGRGWSLRH